MIYAIWIDNLWNFLSQQNSSLTNFFFFNINTFQDHYTAFFFKARNDSLKLLKRKNISFSLNGQYLIKL